MSGPFGPFARLLACPTEGQAAFRAHCANHDGDVESFVDRLRRDPVVVGDVVTGAPLGFEEWPQSYLRWLTKGGDVPSMRLSLDFSSCLYVRNHTPGPVWSLGDKPNSTLRTARLALQGEELGGPIFGWWRPTFFPHLGISCTGSDGSHRSLALKLLGATAELDVDIVDVPADPIMLEALRFWERLDDVLRSDTGAVAARALYEETSEEERSALLSRPREVESRIYVSEETRIDRQFRRVAARRAVRGHSVGKLLAPYCPRDRRDHHAQEWADGGPRSFAEWTRAFRGGLLL